jgi:hypothetical protein
MRERRGGVAAKVCLWLSLSLSAAACGGQAAGEADDEESGASEALSDVGAETDDALARAPWDALGTGVHAKTIEGGGANVLIVYGGYTAQDLYVERWADEHVRARGDRLELAALYAVRGPDQSGYAHREIQNSKLAAHLAAGVAERARSIVIVAHSSGTFVAAELVGMLRDGRGGVPADTLSKVTLFNLDGGGGLDSATMRAMAGAYFVYACDAALGRCSHNASTMKDLGARYASAGGALAVDARSSGCSAHAAGGLWCLHDTLVTTRPHDPLHYDLARDYTDFSGARVVVTSYLDALESGGADR